jgi:hypothetical protein
MQFRLLHALHGDPLVGRSVESFLLGFGSESVGPPGEELYLVCKGFTLFVTNDIAQKDGRVEAHDY